MEIHDASKPGKVHESMAIFSLTPGAVNTASAPSKNDPYPKHMNNITQGKLLLVSSGEYSSYNIAGVYRVLKEIDPNLMIRGWLEAHPEQKERYHFREDDFINWVEDIGFLEKIETSEWYLTGYSSSNEMFTD